VTDIHHRPIAFTERESCDPDTGEPGILRSEWRLVPFNSSDPAHAHIPHLRDYTHNIVLETRYIRRGTVEPWQVFDGYTSEHDALSDIDPRAIAIDCPDLLWIQHERKRIDRERAEELAREQEEKAKREEQQRLRGLSIDAWWKLYNSPRYRPLCDEWNEFTTNPSALVLKSQLESDREFMKLYHLATRGATASITKRQAIRACLDYYNFMWKHRESAKG
jgi:hypothetical protein